MIILVLAILQATCEIEFTDLYVGAFLLDVAIIGSVTWIAHEYLERR